MNFCFIHVYYVSDVYNLIFDNVLPKYGLVKIIRVDQKY